ncbi:MAG: CPXCG motif-containing cysteine-rich protein [Candidatus Omnitrophica bacterium]|nr:CPXCG motif-containing cysteine-rich protein [Candidatus Omnitrophota bacterium]
MHPSESAHIQCPYCGESLEITVEVSVGQQTYIEDCQVCCKPIQFRIRMSADGRSSIDARREDE